MTEPEPTESTEPTEPTESTEPTEPTESTEPTEGQANDPLICPKCRNVLEPGVNCSVHGYAGVSSSSFFARLDPKARRDDKLLFPKTHRKRLDPDTF